MSDHLVGKITVPAQLKTSKAGRLYSEFAVLNKKEKIIACICFGALAEQLVSESKMGDKIIATGHEKDGKFFLSGFSLEEEKQSKENVVKATSRRAPANPVTGVDLLMDKLGPIYVTKRFRELFKDVDSLITKQFPQKAYQELLTELWKEAGIL